MDWDARCAEILESVENWIESLEPDAQPAERWPDGDWRIGRSGTHRSRVESMATAALPEFVIEGAMRFYEREDKSTAA